MAVPSAVRHWVTDAEAQYGPRFDAWFPAGFDWKALAADAPRFAEQLGETWPPATAAGARARLEDLAAAAFRGAYIGALALLAAYDAERDPDEALARLTAPIEDAEAEGFAVRVARDLTVAEELIGGQSPSAEPSPEAVEVARLAKGAGAAIREVLAPGLKSGARALVALGAGGEPSARVLSGVVNVAMAIAGFRYAAALEFDLSEGRTPPQFDVALLESALGLSSSGDVAS